MGLVANAREQAAAAVVPAAVARGNAVLSVLGTAAALFKVRVSALITFTAVVAAQVAAAGEILVADLSWLAFASGLACAGSGCLNHYLDRQIDAAMERTLRRPLPAGRIAHPWAVPIAGAILVTVGLLAAAWRLNTSVALYGLLGVLIYVGVYTIWLKRRTAWNIVVGGLAGSSAVLAGGAAVPAGVAVPSAAVVLALIVFLWTPVHFWSLAIAYEDDYRRAGVPMLPVVAGKRRTGWAILASALALTLVTLAVASWGLLGRLFPVVALAGGGLLVAASTRLLLQPCRRTALAAFGISNLHLFALFLAAMLDVWV